MKTETKTKTVLSVMNVISWIIFIGACINAGALTFSYIMTAVNPEAAKNLYKGISFYELYQSDPQMYFRALTVIIFLACYKAYLAYFVVKIFLKLNLAAPFSEEIRKLITKISYAALAIGLISLIAESYFFDQDSVRTGITPLTNLHEFIGSGDEYLFFGGIIFIIAQVFKRGMELQSENELTI
ncbi:MAG: DUF2975 domain-containing protein [Chryseobacterium sp.]|jgi:hypothetical protein|uniref:DUF2975 domain-containing protein n=1 Tax=Chryseobacterium sp. TaxID=1871047 RepID=UPI002826878D|nr:DUF2975 domain-containing protein [Chryseobacterium sp.]MDR2235774.1 DUF2975 domain-containing protein [Chryseobacterium sp.]